MKTSDSFNPFSLYMLCFPFSHILLPILWRIIIQLVYQHCIMSIALHCNDYSELLNFVFWISNAKISKLMKEHWMRMMKWMRYKIWSIIIVDMHYISKTYTYIEHVYVTKPDSIPNENIWIKWLSEMMRTIFNTVFENEDAKIDIV